MAKGSKKVDRNLGKPSEFFQYFLPTTKIFSKDKVERDVFLKGAN